MASPGVGWECDFGSRYLLRTDIAWAEALPGRHEHQGDLAVIRWTGRQVAAEVKSFGESCLFETISNHGHPSYVGVGLRRRY
jgi:hypothetical protein